jgi:hypothetical protein
MRRKGTIGAANVDVKLNGQIYERVDNLKNLGALVTSQNETETDIKDKIAASNRCFQAFNKMLGTRYLSKDMKIRTYKTIIRPVILYGSQTWAVAGKMASTLMTWETKVLRKIYGPKNEQGVWRIRNNLEIQNMYKSPDIVTEIKVRRLECSGYVVRMENTRLKKFNAEPEGRFGVGNSRLRCLDDVEANIRAVGVKKWRIKAQDRR